GALLARSPAPVDPDGGRLDDRLAAVRRFRERRNDISLAVLEGREGLAAGVLRLRDCLEEVGPDLAAPARARLPDPGEPGQVASYLYHLCGLLASAGSGVLLSGRGLFLGRVGLLEVLLLFTAIVQADPGLDLLGAEQTLRLSDGLLAVLPARLDWVEPRALAGQLAHHDPHPALRLG